ncbi:MAG TPA: hypothetical protein VK174_16395 [Chitinophagales bacterium]|nr:hypothetical protein [Chitinophagales bacterium]
MFTTDTLWIMGGLILVTILVIILMRGGGSSRDKYNHKPDN